MTSCQVRVLSNGQVLANKLHHLSRPIKQQQHLIGIAFPGGVTPVYMPRTSDCPSADGWKEAMLFPHWAACGSQLLAELHSHHVA